MGNVRVRPANMRDADKIVRWVRLLAEADGEYSSFRDHDFFHDVMGNHPAVSMWVAEYQGKEAGFISAYPGYDLHTATRGWHLGDIFIEAAYRRKGVGKALVALLARHCRAGGGEWLSWTVARKNERAQAFYRSVSAQSMPVLFMALGKSTMDGLSREPVAATP